MAELSEPDESLLATCVTLNPEYHYNPKFTPGSALGAGHALHELTKSMNVLLACTDERLIVLNTGGGGGPREHASLAYAGLTIVSRGKKEFVLGAPDGEIRFRGAAKQQLPRLLEVIEAQSSAPD